MNHETIPVMIDGCSYDIFCRYRLVSDDLIVFLHGLGCSQDSFENAWHDPALTDLSILGFDLPGFGRSEKPPGFSYALEDHARVCGKVIRCFSGHRIHLVGHSMGGAIGLLLSKDILDATLSFINVEGNLIGEDCGLLSRKTAGVSYDVFVDHLFRDIQNAFQGGAYGKFSLDMASPLAFYRSAESLVAWSDGGRLLERFKALKCRKAYVYGDRNAGMKVLSQLGAIEKQGIGKSGHFPMNDHPEAFYPTLVKLLCLLH